MHGGLLVNIQGNVLRQGAKLACWHAIVTAALGEE